MKGTRSFCGLLLAVLVLLPGCVHVPTYHKQSFNVINHNYDYCVTQNDITVHAKCLTQSDMKALFGVHGMYFNAMNVMYVSIFNMSDQGYSMSAVYHNFEPMTYNKIKGLLQTNSLARVSQGTATGLGLAAVTWTMIFTSLFYIGTSGKTALITMYVATGFVPVLFLFGALPFFGLSIKSVMMNKRIKNDLEEKILHDGKVIFSGQHYEGLVFMKKADHKPHFDVVMHAQDKDKDCVMFNVKVPSL